MTNRRRNYHVIYEHSRWSFSSFIRKFFHDRYSSKLSYLHFVCVLISCASTPGAFAFSSSRFSMKLHLLLLCLLTLLIKLPHSLNFKVCLEHDKLHSQVFIKRPKYLVVILVKEVVLKFLESLRLLLMNFFRFGTVARNVHSPHKTYSLTVANTAYFHTSANWKTQKTRNLSLKKCRKIFKNDVYLFLFLTDGDLIELNTL